jgi:hypothetical protein
MPSLLARSSIFLSVEALIVPSPPLNRTSIDMHNYRRFLKVVGETLPHQSSFRIGGDIFVDD